MPTPHMITTPEPVTTDARGEWLELSAAMTEEVTLLADRDDLTVTCAPGAGRGSPGCFIPALATVELDGAHLGHAPASCDPSCPSDRERYPALWGVLVHEAAHARHTLWKVPNGTHGACAEAALALEESRIEAAQTARRPIDRKWLRASAKQLVLADFTPPATSGEPCTVSATMTPWDAARAAALVLARADAGILEDTEVIALKDTIAGILGTGRLSDLSALWHTAYTTADDDHETMLDLGRRWCAVLGIDPDRPAPDHRPKEGSSPGPSPLADAIAATMTAVKASASPAVGSVPTAAQRRAEEKAVRRRAQRTAERVFKTHPDTGRRGPTAITGTRPATGAEQAAARRLSRVLRAAAHRERVTTTTTSATPPGRLRMRDALAADAQRAAGAIPTAEPFTRTTRRHVPAPPLRLGIACDVSGSMAALAGPVASSAWILAKAAAHVPDAQSATVIFGAKVRAVVPPGQTPAKVRQFSAHDSTERFVEAVDALDAALDLARPGAARLLVIVSDGIFTPEERADGQKRIRRMTASGCAVLWLGLDFAMAMDGTHHVKLTDPADAVKAIGEAATRALREA